MVFDSDRRYDKEEENYPFFDKNKEGYTPEEAIKILMKAQMYDHIKKCIKNNGLERTEDMIKLNYKTMPKLEEKLLKTLYFIWGK